ncbi:MAG: Stealth CR1 domain-containing protein [Jatrophihabitans sp.]
MVQRNTEITGPLATRLNRDLAVELCEKVGVPFFAVPPSATKQLRIGIADERWSDFVGQLLRHGETVPLYVGFAARARSGGRRRWSGLTGEANVRRAAREQRSIEVFRVMADNEWSQLFDRPWACLVERWDRDEEGALHAPTRNAVATAIAPLFQGGATLEQAGRALPTYTPFTKRGLFDIDFPIDAVYMWVDGSDPSWLARKAATLARYGLSVDTSASHDARFRDGGELRYSLRSIERFAPWIRRVYLVTDQQVPRWLNLQSPLLTVIDHTEIFGSNGSLPSFNSHAIGARLHHIDGLSDHYLHFNDDVFLGREVWPTSFFQSNGHSRFFLSRSTLGYSSPDIAPAHESARRNVAQILERDFGSSPSNAFFHTPIAQQKQIMSALESRYHTEFQRTWRNQFRASTDIEVNQWLHHYYAYLVGEAEPGSISYDYFDLSDDRAWIRMRRLTRLRDRDAFCVNDSLDATIYQQERAAKWLDDYFGGASQFER